MLSTEHFLLFASIVLFAGIMAGKVGYRFGIPTLLIFLFTGMLFGVDGFGFQFSNADVAQSVGIIALSIILFTGGMDTRIRKVRPVIAQGLTLSTLGVLLTALLSGFFIFWLSGSDFGPYPFALSTSLLLAATMASTDSASVFAILRSQKMQLKENLAPTLEMESGSNDPMAYMLTIALIDFITTGQSGIGPIVLTFILQFVVGGTLGFLMGRLAVFILNRMNIHNDTLYPITLLCMVFFTFSVTSLLQGNGYLAVYIAGIVVGNNRVIHKKSINTFLDGITWLVQIILFILLGLLVNPREMLDVAPFSLVVGAFMILIARPLAVYFCLIPFRKISFRGKTFLSWVGLRGAVPIIFATYPMIDNIPGADQLFNVVFFITILSLLVQGSTISQVARWLGLDIPSPPIGSLLGVEIPDETGPKLEERVVDASMLSHGDLLMNLSLRDEELVILVRRGEGYRVPKGRMHLQVGDVLLIVSEKNLSQTLTSGDPENHPGLLQRLKHRLLRR